MVYFNMHGLVGRSSVKAYEEYIYLLQWLNANICRETWDMDYTTTVSINGINIPCGIKFYDFEDAKWFVKSALLY